MEKDISNRLRSYIERTAILYPQQLGFRSGHSVDLTLINIQEVIATAIDTNKFSAGIFQDLTNALTLSTTKFYFKNECSWH